MSEVKPAFTAHNVRLDDGTETYPPAGFTMDRHWVTRAVGRLLKVLYPDGLVGKTLIDIGCLEGGFAAEFARMGMTATGIEVRESNYRNCLYIKERLNLPNLDFRQGDANDIETFGPHDVVFVSGLLYHLDKPRRFLELAAKNCGKALVIWTHVAYEENTPAVAHYSLSQLTENEGLRGRWYPEHGEIPQSELDQLKWASWDNKASFWVQKEHLLHLLREIGFDLVFEQFDVMDDIVGDMSEGFYKKIDRVMLVAIKSGLTVEPPVRATPLTPIETIRARTEAAPVSAPVSPPVLSPGAAAGSAPWNVTGLLRRVGRLPPFR